MPGSSFNIACTNATLNTAAAEFCAVCRRAGARTHLPRCLWELIRGELTATQRILFTVSSH